MTRTAILVGAGSYVVGDSFGPGVVLPTLLDAARNRDLDKIVLVTRSARPAAFWKRVSHFKSVLGAEDVEVTEFVTDAAADWSALPMDASSRAFIAVPDEAHAEYIERFLAAGVPTWTVKPLTGSGAESRRLNELAHSSGTPLWVDYHKRFDDSNRKLKALVDSGDVGRALMLSIQYSQPWRTPLEDLKAWANDVNVFQYIGCHYVDLVFYLFPGARPTRVSATGLAGRLAESGGPAFDVVHALVDFEIDGATLRTDFQVGWNDPTGSPAKSHQRLEMTLTKGRVILDQKERGFEVWHDDRFEQVNPYFFQILPDASSGRRRVSGYGPESLRCFLAHCEDSDAAEKTLGLPWSDQAWRTDAVVDAVQASLRASGDWIAV